MGLLDGQISSIFAGVLSGLFLEATLHAGTAEPIYDEGGNIIGYTGGDFACRAQVDQASEAMRQASGFAEQDVRVIILRAGLATEVNSDMQITVRGQLWNLLSVETDAAASHWICRGRAV